MRIDDSKTALGSKAAETIREKTEVEQETPLRGRTMRGQAKLGSRALYGIVEFYSPWKKREDAHSTRLRNHKSKWYRFETARGWRSGEEEGKGERERENAWGRSVYVQRKRGCCVGEEGCYERCVQLTVACSVRIVLLTTGVVNARGIPTYLRQFLFMADPPSPQGRWGRSFSLIGIELLFSFINDAGNPSSTILYQCYHHRTECTRGKGLSQTVNTLLSRGSNKTNIYSPYTHNIHTL